MSPALKHLIWLLWCVTVKNTILVVYSHVNVQHVGNFNDVTTECGGKILHYNSNEMKNHFYCLHTSWVLRHLQAVGTRNRSSTYVNAAVFVISQTLYDSNTRVINCCF